MLLVFQSFYYTKNDLIAYLYIDNCVLIVSNIIIIIVYKVVCITEYNVIFNKVDILVIDKKTFINEYLYHSIHPQSVVQH